MTGRGPTLPLAAALLAAGGAGATEISPGVHLPAPEGAAAERLAGKDSDVGRLSAPGIACAWDVGPYSAGGDRPGRAVEVDGAPAVLAEGEGRVSLHVPRVPGDPPPVRRVDATCLAETAEALDRARSMLLGLTFD